MVIAKCAWCGKEFEKIRGRKCCSSECSVERHKQYGKEYHKKYYTEKTKPEAQKVLTKCALCGSEFHKIRGQKYCSPDCSTEGRNQSNKKHWQSDGAKQYRKEYKKSDKYKQYIQSDEYKQKDKERRQTEEYKQRQQEYNKKRNASDEYKQSRKEYLKKYTQSEEFAQWKKEYQQSEEFKAIARNRANKRRALKKQSFVENVDHTFIAERDNWTCQLCGKKISDKYKWPHPMSLEVDHIIPLSKGGEHSYANCQAVHKSCNCSKNNRTWAKGEQLRIC